MCWTNGGWSILIFCPPPELENNSPGALLKAILLKLQRQLGGLPQIYHSDSSVRDYVKVFSNAGLGDGDGTDQLVNVTHHSSLSPCCLPWCMSSYPSPVPPWLPESLPEGYGHSRGSFNCFLGTLLLFLWTRLCFLEDARTTNFWRRPEPDNFVVANPTPLLQEHFSRRLTGSQRKRSYPWRRNLTKVPRNQPTRHCLSLWRPQDSFTRWEKCYPKETYSSQELHCPQTGNALICVTSVTCMFLSWGNTCGPILVLSVTSKKATKNVANILLKSIFNKVL